MRGIKQGNLDLLLAYLKMSPRKKSFRLDHIEESPPHQSVNKTLETVPPPHSLATPRRRTESTDGGPAEAPMMLVLGEGQWQVVQDSVMRAPIVHGRRDIMAVAWLS